MTESRHEVRDDKRQEEKSIDLKEERGCVASAGQGSETWEEQSCECIAIHEDIVAAAGEQMPEEEKLYDLAELFKVFGDTTRVKILCALFASEMCVCDIASLLSMSQSAISHQLRVLKQARLVKYRKSGKVVFYSLDDEHIKNIFAQGLLHINE